MSIARRLAQTVRRWKKRKVYMMNCLLTAQRLASFSNVSSLKKSTHERTNFKQNYTTHAFGMIKVKLRMHEYKTVQHMLILAANALTKVTLILHILQWNCEEDWSIAATKRRNRKTKRKNYSSKQLMKRRDRASHQRTRTALLRCILFTGLLTCPGNFAGCQVFPGSVGETAQIFIFGQRTKQERRRTFNLLLPLPYPK